MSQMMRLLEVGRRRIIDCLFWITVFSLRLFLATSAVDMQVNKVIINEDQHTFHCTTGGDVWYYKSTMDESFVNTVALGDTSYIVSPPNLHLTQIKAAHEGYYSCDTDSTVVQLIVLGMPRFVGCFDDSPCEADDVQTLPEGDNIRFNISVDYIPGGPLGENQELRLVGLLKENDILLNCLKDSPGSCVYNPTLTQAERNRIQFWRNASNPWMGIEINITNAMVDDTATYHVELEANDAYGGGTVTQSTSTITVVVTTTLTSMSMTSSISLSSSLDSSSSSSSGSQETGLPPSSTSVRISLSSTQTTPSPSSTGGTTNSPLLTASTVTEEGVDEPTGEIEEAIVVVIILASSFLILAVLGIAVFVVLFFKKKDSRKLEHSSSKVVELKSSSTTQQVFFNDSQTTVTTYTMEDNTVSAYSCYVGKSPSFGDDISLPRGSIILVDDHRNSDAVPV